MLVAGGRQPGREGWLGTGEGDTGREQEGGVPPLLPPPTVPPPKQNRQVRATVRKGESWEGFQGVGFLGGGEGSCGVSVAHW